MNTKSLTPDGSHKKRTICAVLLTQDQEFAGSEIPRPANSKQIRAEIVSPHDFLKIVRTLQIHGHLAEARHVVIRGAGRRGKRKRSEHRRLAGDLARPGAANEIAREAEAQARERL